MRRELLKFLLLVAVVLTIPVAFHEGYLLNVLIFVGIFAVFTEAGLGTFNLPDLYAFAAEGGGGQRAVEHGGRGVEYFGGVSAPGLGFYGSGAGFAGGDDNPLALGVCPFYFPALTFPVPRPLLPCLRSAQGAGRVGRAHAGRRGVLLYALRRQLQGQLVHSSAAVGEAKAPL